MRSHNRKPEVEPVALDQVIGSMPSPASTPPPPTSTPTYAFRLHAREQRHQQQHVRSNHPRSREGLNQKLRAALRSLANGEEPWPLYLWSNGPGTGKTSAALLMLDIYGNQRDGYSREVHEFMNGFADFAALPELFRQAESKRHYLSTPHGCDTIYPNDLWTFVREAKLLVLDDLRKPSDREQRLGDDHFGILKRILDLRLGRPLIVTSNVNPYEREGYGSDLVRLFDDRVASRILCGTRIELKGSDRRQE